MQLGYVWALKHYYYYYYVNLTTIWMATPQGASNMTQDFWGRSALVMLRTVGRLQVDVTASPNPILSAGKKTTAPRRFKCCA
jgi:hypothetical protein